MRRRGGRKGVRPLTAGLIAIAFIVVGTYLIASRDIPFINEPYELKAAFANANNVQPGSPVRIAGVPVGEVQSVEGMGGDSTASIVTMKIKDDGLPIHKDATLMIRPRIFLEGNFFVDLRPGSPESPKLDDGGTIPMTQTTNPVQLDQVLTSLQENTRDSLQQLLQGYGEAINGKPATQQQAQAENADQDKSVKRLTAGQALNQSLRYAPGALKGTAIVNQAFQGTEVHDLSKLVAGTQKVSAILASREESLKDLVTNFNTTVAATAAESGNLQQTIHLLPEVLARANPALTHLNASFPPTRAFAREILPGVNQTAATIDASFPWIAQTSKLVSPPELQGLVAISQPAVADLAQLTDGTVQLVPQADLVSRCALDVVLPAGDIKVQDPPLSTGVENYKEFFHGLVGLAGESQNFDGNGQYVRFNTGGGPNTVSTGSVPSAGGSLFANSDAPPIGSRPARPANKPPFNSTKPCYQNPVPNVNGAKTAGGP
jgi:ABC-type transporter Mla subunit MlaD